MKNITSCNINMDSEIYVSCHAPSLSLLLFETVRSVHDQKGLLIGEICKEIISKKTDENEMNREQRTTIYLEHCIPVTEPDFFGNVGNVNKEKLQKYVDQYSSKIVGWYSFRRNSRVTCRSLREMVTHKSLVQSMEHVKPEYFIAAFLSASVGENLSTHTYNHVFTRFHPSRSVFEPLKLKIFTMSDKVTNTSGYYLKTCFPVSKNFEKITNLSQEAQSPVTSVLTINKDVSSILKQINNKLQEAEKNRNDLEIQIMNLKKRLSLDQMNEIKVDKIETESEEIPIQYIRYDPNVNYNPERKENPIKVVELKETPTVPEEAEEVRVMNSDNELDFRDGKERGDAERGVDRGTYDPVSNHKECSEMLVSVEQKDDDKDCREAS